MQAIEYAERNTKERLEEAIGLQDFHERQVLHYDEKIEEYNQQLDELRRAREVLKENGF